MFEKLTKRTRQAVALANLLACELGSDTIGDIELLLGLIREGGLAESMLKLCRVDWFKVQNELRGTRKPATPRPSQRLPQTEMFRLILLDAAKISFEAGDRYIGTEHILLGILRNSNYEAAAVLRRHGLDFEKANSVWKKLNARDD